jgi:hypothetical protein
VVKAMVALLLSVPLYPFFIRSMEAAAARNAARGASGAPAPAPPVPVRPLSPRKTGT